MTSKIISSVSLEDSGHEYQKIVTYEKSTVYEYL